MSKTRTRKFTHLRNPESYPIVSYGMSSAWYENARVSFSYSGVLEGNNKSTGGLGGEADAGKKQGRGKRKGRRSGKGEERCGSNFVKEVGGATSFKPLRIDQI